MQNLSWCDFPARTALLVRGNFRITRLESDRLVLCNQVRLVLCHEIGQSFMGGIGTRRPPSRPKRCSSWCSSIGSHSGSARRWALVSDKLAKRKSFQNGLCPIANVLVLVQFRGVQILPLPVVHLAHDREELITAAALRVHAQLTESSHALRILLLWMIMPAGKSSDLAIDVWRSCCRHGKHTKQAGRT